VSTRIPYDPKALEELRHAKEIATLLRSAGIEMELEPDIHPDVDPSQPGTRFSTLLLPRVGHGHIRITMPGVGSVRVPYNHARSLYRYTLRNRPREEVRLAVYRYILCAEPSMVVSTGTSTRTVQGG